MAYEIISQNNTVTTLADENGNVITVPARAMLALGETFTLTKVNNNTATLEDSTGKVYRDIPCCIDLTQVTGFNVTKVNNNKATLEDGDGNVYAGVPCIVNLTGTGGGSAVIEELNVTPSTSAQTITASGGVDGYSPVNVAAVTSSIDANIVAGNIKNGVEILGVTGSVVELNGETKTVTPQVYGQTLYPTAPKNAITEITVNAVTSSIDANIQAGNIKNGVTILGVTGNYSGAAPEYYVKYKKNGSNALVPDTSELISLSGLTSIGYYALAYAYAGTDISALSIVSPISIRIQEGGLFHTFGSCHFVNPAVDLSGITNVSTQGLKETFASSDVQTLVIGATNLGSQACMNMCNNCSQLTTISFTNVSTISIDALGQYAYFDFAFQDCPNLTAIHFPAAMQATVEAMAGYSDKWGASNATIYFDL